MVEQAVGISSVAQIFKQHSEAFFRDNEVVVMMLMTALFCGVIGNFKYSFPVIC